jgi:GNAT superfamily N-acetyltransferase
MKIIPAESRHLEEIISLSQLLYLPELQDIKPFIWSERDWVRQHLNIFFVVEHNNIVIGAMSLQPYLGGGHAEIESIVVLEEYQGKGIGKLLLSFAESFTILGGGHELTLGTFTEHKKVLFYKSQGFREVGRSYYLPEKFGKKFPYYTMRKTL